MSSTNFYYEVDEEKLRVYWQNILERPELVKSIQISEDKTKMIITMTDNATAELPMAVLWANVLNKPALVQGMEGEPDKLVVTMVDGTKVDVAIAVLWDSVGQKPELVQSVTKDGDKLVITNLDGTTLEISLEVLWTNITNKPNLMKGITSGEDKLTVTYMDNTTVDIPVSTSGGLNVSQVTEMDVTAPKNVVIPITETPYYATPPVEVLKYVPGETNKTETLCEFNAEDAAKFEENPFVAFDGKMYLKTQETFPSVQDTTFTEGFLTVTTIDKSKIGEIVSIEVI